MVEGFDDETLPPPEETATAERTADTSGPLIGGPVPRPDEQKEDRRPKPLAGEFRRGEELDHFVVLRELGAGAMGVVLEAHDPDLDRKVAIKLVRAGRTSTDAAQVRMLREAQSMARVTHPNVVAVHQVGTVRGQVYIAMEFIDGRSLKQWCREHPRTLKQILEVFDKAGQGLHAAHQVDLVHRDFKPDNVLVSHAGRVAVTDFGLVAAQARSHTAEHDVSRGGTTSGGGALSLDLTRTGHVLGTPAYMAPEQHRDQTIDARADQFSFCVALWEAVYGERPFAGASVMELTANVFAGRRDEAGTSSAHGEHVPRRIRRVLERGLSIDPRDRFEDMPAVLAALRPRRRRALPVLGLAGVTAVAAAALFAQRGRAPEPVDLCRQSGRDLAGQWSDERRSQVTTAFEATGRAFASDVSGDVVEAFDRWVQRWTEVHDEVCTATYERGETSESGLDLQRDCLRDEFQQTLALSEALAQGLDETSLVKASVAVLDLPQADQCLDVTRLVRRDQRLDPAVAAKVRELRRDLRVADASYDLGKSDRALELAEPLLKRARAISDPGVTAEVLLTVAKAQRKLGSFDDCERNAREAMSHAADAQLLEVEAEAWLSVVLSLVAQSKLVEADATLSAAEIATRKTDDARLQGQFYNAVASLRHQQARLDDAEHAARAAVAVLEKAGLTDVPELGIYLNSLAVVVSDQGRAAEAMKAYAHAIEVMERQLGPHHPNIAAPLSNMGIQLQLEGKLEEARANYARTLEIWTGAYGKEHHRIAIAYDNLGVIDQYQGRLDDAHEKFERALKIRLDTLGDRHPQVASSYTNLALVDFYRGDYDAAEQRWTRARDLFIETQGPDSLMLVDVEFNLGYIEFARKSYPSARAHFQRVLQLADTHGFDPTHHRRLGAMVSLADVHRYEDRCDEALPILDEAEVGFERGIGVNNVDGARLWTCRGWCALADGRVEDAVVALSRSIEIRAGDVPDEPGVEAQDRFALAKALWDLGRKDEAVASAERAVADLRTHGQQWSAIVEEVEQWLALHQP